MGSDYDLCGGTSGPWTVRVIELKELKEALQGWSRPEEGRKPVTGKMERVVRDESQPANEEQRGLYLRNQAKMAEHDRKGSGKSVSSQFLFFHKER